MASSRKLRDGEASDSLKQAMFAYAHRRRSRPGPEQPSRPATSVRRAATGERTRPEKRGIATKVDLVPHNAPESVLKREASIYRQGKTPVTDPSGRLQAWNMKPAAPKVAGEHLGIIRNRFGDQGLDRTVHGLSVTRGSTYVGDAIKHAPAPVRARVSGAALGPTTSDETRIVGGSDIGKLTRSSRGRPLPESDRLPLSRSTGDSLRDVRIHDDATAHRAAQSCGARAFTLGRSIYFGTNEYRPQTHMGSRLLSHEVAHAVQQKGAAGSPGGQLRIQRPNAPNEKEADRFANGHGKGETRTKLTPGAVKAATIMRQISFTRANDAFTVNNPAAQENVAGTHFQIAQGAAAAPHFAWGADFTIHGHAGDPFGNFQVGPLQVVRGFWLNVWWGTGANRSHLTSSVTTPIRDAIDATQTWYADVLASAAFTADGDVRAASINDTPGINNVPFANPVPPRVSTRGWFNWGMSFVAYLGAQDTTNPGAAGFRPLANVYWNLSLSGDFDTARAAGARVRVSGGGRTNRSGVIEGTSTAFPPMFGGDIFNDQSNANVTIT